MVSTEMISALTEARKRVPAELWRALSREISAIHSNVSSDSIQRVLAHVPNRDAAWILSEAFRASSNSIAGIELSAAMDAVDCAVADSRPPVELIWTGPSNSRPSLRRIDQTLYDLISEAQRRIILVTFAAHRVAHLCDHLKLAVDRGAELTLIVESEEESEGQLTLDAITAFKSLPIKKRIYYWPLAQRERNAAGRPGKLHVKCAIVDDAALVGSANLTDDAFNRNMELDVLVRDSEAVAILFGHFEELIQRKVLIEVQIAR